MLTMFSSPFASTSTKMSTRRSVISSSLAESPSPFARWTPKHSVFQFAKPYGVEERLFDGLAILPRHLLEKPYQEGKLGATLDARPRHQMSGPASALSA